MASLDSSLLVPALQRGICNCLGIYYVEFLESFETSRGIVSWTTSICSGLVFGAGLFVGMVIEKYGPRICTAAGGLLCFIGLLSSAFAEHIAIIYLCFGVFTGTGACLVCLSSFVALGQHFDKGRGAASSLAVVGSGLGGLLFPVVLRPIIDWFTWRGSMIIMSGLMLNLLPASRMFVVPKPKPDIPQAKEDSKTPRISLCSDGMWRNPSFVCYAIICPIISIGYQYAYIVIVDLGILLGFNKIRSTFLLTYMSLSSTMSSLCFGCVLKLLWNQNVLLFNVCLISMSVAMFAFPYVTSYETLVVVSALYGVAIGGINGLYAVVTADLLGLKRYSIGLGIVCTVFGIGYLLSAPVAGVINDFTGTYNIAFYVAGSLCAGCAALFGVVRGIHNRRLRSSEGTMSGMVENLELTIS
ncbi:monocarboxylate transporter 13-like [Liolophura sinensis]|uniref:monocarboxylate transporter 13-like n=1 Tax=Liolophura sinensis TaxID=3198878 RepID=UPI00315924F3